jgi:FeS assembly protein IscX
MKWNNIEDIVEALEEKHPDLDIMSIRYTLLKKIICELEHFEGEQDKCNEKVLEAIQSEWIHYRNEI